MQTYQFQPPMIAIATSGQNLAWSTTFSDAAYPTNNVNNPVGRVGVHWESSDYFFNDYGINFRPGVGGDGSEGIVNQAGGSFSVTVPNPADHLWHPTGDDRICTDANNPLGTGKGFRHWRCNAGTGQNNGGGGVNAELASPVTELWCRFYMRYQLGFTWGPFGIANPGYTKDMRCWGTNGMVFGIQGGASWGIHVPPNTHTSSKSWQATMGGMKGDGLFHCYEWHVKNGASGIVEIWVDDQLVYSFSGNVPASAMQSILIGSNQNAVGDSNGLSVSNGGVLTDWYTDYDDIAFSTTGRIGPL